MKISVSWSGKGKEISMQKVLLVVTEEWFWIYYRINSGEKSGLIV